MTYTLTKQWADPNMERLAHWTATIMEASESTALEIGVTPEAIVAQAALESNWGRNTVGQHNLFGIKVGSDWTGAVVMVPTWEVRNGQRVYETDAFRDYPTFADSIEDHFQFLKQNSRYAAHGIFHTSSDQDYFNKLLEAGYATDPAYADKLGQMLASVKMFTSHMDRHDGEPSSDTAPGPIYNRVLIAGTQGPDVTAVQKILGLPITGNYDGPTQAGVEAFQQAKGLTADGIVGALTAHAMGLV